MLGNIDRALPPTAGRDHLGVRPIDVVLATVKWVMVPFYLGHTGLLITRAARVDDGLPVHLERVG